MTLFARPILTMEALETSLGLCTLSWITSLRKSPPYSARVPTAESGHLSAQMCSSHHKSSATLHCPCPLHAPFNPTGAPTLPTTKTYIAQTHLVGLGQNCRKKANYTLLVKQFLLSLVYILMYTYRISP